MRAWRAGLCAVLAATVSGLELPAWAAAPSNRELVEITDLSSLGLSPDGRFGVFRTEQADIERNSYILRWHSVDLATGKMHDIGSGGTPVYLHPGSIEPAAPLWLADGRTIVFRALVDGAIGIWRASVEGTRSEALAIGDADIETISLTDDGQAITYRTGPTRAAIRQAEDTEYDRGILVDRSVDLSQTLYRGGSINGRMASQRLVGFWFIRDGLLWRSPRYDHRLDLGTGKVTPIGQPILPGAVYVPPQPPPLEARGPDGTVVRADWDGAGGSLSATTGDGHRIVCVDPRCRSQHVVALLWRPGTHEVIATSIDRLRRQTVLRWNVDTARLSDITKSDGLLAGGRRYMVPCAIARAALLCVAASAASPPRIERIDLATGARRVLFDPNAAMRSAYRPVVRPIEWTFDGSRRATGILMLPAGASPRPVPLYLNYYLCEGFLRGGEGEEWPIPALLDAGFAVACVNSVPNPGPQDALADDGIALDAVRALIARLASEGLVDRGKVAMGGLSHGSEIAMWIASHSDLLAAVSISSGQLEPVNYWEGLATDSDQPAIYRQVWGLGAPDETPARWTLISSALNAEHIRTPILFQLPEQEARRIPELVARLVRAKNPTELYAFPDEDHIKLQPRHRLAIYERNLDWFRYWLQDYRDPDPGKAAQYQRWDALRRARPVATPRSPPATAPAPASRSTATGAGR